MQAKFNPALAEGYTSTSQRIRILSEGWVSQEVFCPSCGSAINKYENNRPVADFYCSICKEDYELKGKSGGIGNKIVDGAFDAVIKRLRSDTNPNLFMLNYNSRTYEVVNFFVIPKYFFVPDIIEKRKPLSPHARRAGWVGCNIILESIPQTGKVFYVKDKQVEPKEAVIRSWQKTLFVKNEVEVSARTWVLDIMSCIEKLGKSQFSLNNMYDFEDYLWSKHPNNRHVKEKIRQQLQVLRDNSYLEFVGKGQYKLT